MENNLRVILQQLEAERSIDRETLIEAIRSAIESAARKSMVHAANVIVEINQENLSFNVFEIRAVVEEVEDSLGEITLEDARLLNPQAEIGHRLKVRTEPKDFGRIAAQTAKQVIIQKIKDAVRDNVYDEFKQREGELVTGLVKRLSHGNVIVMVDKAEAVLPPREQSPRETFKPGDRLRALLVSVEKTPRGAQVILSRTATELVRGLFDLEVPEIYDGTIEIKAISREPGSRTKVAVASNDSNVDPVGACVGMKGSRVRSVVEELSGEKIDIVRWSDDPLELCANALNPADIIDMTPDEENETIIVVVPHDQLSLAIGKKGQNARLASRLVGWNIDIRSDLELEGGATKEDTTKDATKEDTTKDAAKEVTTEDAAKEVTTEEAAEASGESVSEDSAGAPEDTGGPESNPATPGGPVAQGASADAVVSETNAPDRNDSG